MIENIYPYPYLSPADILHDGPVKKISNICMLCYSKECKSAFQEKSGYIGRCWKGYNFLHLKDWLNNSIISVGFLISGEKYPENHKELLKEGYIVTKNDLENIIKNFSEGGNMQQRLQANEAKSESRALHDLKYLITALTRVVERREVKEASEIYSQYNWELLLDTTDKVYKILSAIKNQIELSDLIIAPYKIREDETININIDGLFLRSIEIYNVLAKSRDKIINPIKRLQLSIDANRNVNKAFVLLPPILLENAIKYSSGTDINVEAQTDNNLLTISVKSFGPIVPYERREDIWKLGKQYVNENDTKKGGSGFGLYLAKEICKSSGFEITYEAENITTGSIPSGLNVFKVSEKFKTSQNQMTVKTTRQRWSIFGGSV